jgi:hypothetical protein
MSHAVRLAPEPPQANLSGPALRTFFRITELWGLSADEQMTILGRPARSTFFKWKKQENDASLPRDTLERISYVIGIFGALQLLLPNRQAADSWIRRPNRAPLFGGRSALERMLSGQVGDLFVVRQFLDAQRGWA